jgi:hypothetical protein
MVDQVQLLSHPANFAVVQLSQRKYPGVVIQGDTLHSLVKQLERMSRLLDSGASGEALDEIKYVTGILTEALKHYEQICSERGIELPYAGYHSDATVGVKREE